MVDQDLLWSTVPKTPENVDFARKLSEEIASFRQEGKKLGNPFGFTVQKRRLQQEHHHTSEPLKKFDDMTNREKLVAIVLGGYKHEVFEGENTSIVRSREQRKTLCCLSPEYMELYKNLVETNSSLTSKSILVLEP